MKWEEEEEEEEEKKGSNNKSHDVLCQKKAKSE